MVSNIVKSTSRRVELIQSLPAKALVDAGGASNKSC